MLHGSAGKTKHNQKFQRINKDLSQYNRRRNLATLTEKNSFACGIFEVRGQNYHTQTHCRLPEFEIAYISTISLYTVYLISLYSSAVTYASYAKRSMDFWRLFLDQENLAQDE